MSAHVVGRGCGGPPLSSGVGQAALHRGAVPVVEPRVRPPRPPRLTPDARTELRGRGERRCACGFCIGLLSAALRASTQYPCARPKSRGAGRRAVGEEVHAAAEEAEGSEETSLWRRAYEAERQLLQTLIDNIDVDTKKKRVRELRKKAVDKALAASAGSAAIVAIRQSAAAWRQAYEVLRDANADLERARSGDPQPKSVKEAVQETKEALKERQFKKMVEDAIEKTVRQPALIEGPQVGSEPLRTSSKKILNITDLKDVLLDGETLAEITELRDTLGPGTLPLLAPLFGKAACDEAAPPMDQVLLALSLAGTDFRPRTTLDLKRSCVVRGILSGSDPGKLLKLLQQRLDGCFGQGRLTVCLQRERCAPMFGIDGLVSQSAYQDVGAVTDSNDNRAALFVFITKDLPVAEKAGPGRRLLIGASLVVSAVLCNVVASAIYVAETGGDQSLTEFATGTNGLISVQQETYSELFGVAATRLDTMSFVPIGVVLLLAVLAQEVGRGLEATYRGVKIQGGPFVPWPVVGCLFRPWEPEGLLPSRKIEAEVTLAGRLAGSAVAVLAALIGYLRNDTIDGPLLADLTRLPLVVSKALGAELPVDPSVAVVGLKDAVPASLGPAMAHVDPLLFAGAASLMAQAVSLLPLDGLDGYVLARFAFGPRVAKGLELVTAILLLIGAVGRLGPGADQLLCSGALVCWLISTLTRESRMVPLEDFEDGKQHPVLTAISIFLLASAVVVLIPGNLEPYGLLPFLE